MRPPLPYLQLIHGGSFFFERLLHTVFVLRRLVARTIAVRLFGSGNDESQTIINKHGLAERNGTYFDTEDVFKLELELPPPPLALPAAAAAASLGSKANKCCSNASNRDEGALVKSGISPLSMPTFSATFRNSATRSIRIKNFL